MTLHDKANGEQEGSGIFSLPRWLCEGDAVRMSGWVRGEAGVKSEDGSVGRCIFLILLGCGLYGFAIGLWRAPLMGMYVALKLPLLIFLVVAANGILNGLFSQLMGSDLGFRETMHTILISFTTFAVVVGSLAPVAILMAVNTPPPGAVDAGRWHGLTLLAHTGVIAYAGVLANLKMFRLMLAAASSASGALRTFGAWTAGNLFLGAQLAYASRPFFGSPGLSVQFLREDPLHGNFYFAVWSALRGFVGNEAMGTSAIFLGGLIFGLFIMLYRQLENEIRNQEKS